MTAARERSMTLRLEAAQHVRVQTVARIQRSNVTNVIRAAIDAYFDLVQDDEDFQQSLRQVYEDNHRTLRANIDRQEQRRR